ncbi:hypothetical protein [Arcticibacter tournemirensis]|uniref:Tetratricopeptide repeat protein n=2 Tax=Arcticibacter tournemirensis TaxID=699437 RepID=A0A5M9HBB6_9SPHI|nr:hypothetical protein F1649_11230 [Arcticibacter tournemirensis]
MTNMIRYFFILFVLSTSFTNLNAFDIKQVRQEFYAAVKDKDAAEKFCEKMKAMRSSDPLLTAYYGSAQAIMAKHSWNPYRKVAYLKSGLHDLEKAVASSPESLEIRFLRFSVEHYMPSFLGLGKHLEEDRKKIVELVEKDSFGTADSTLVKNIIIFLKKTNRFNTKEVEILNEGIKNG